METSLHENEVYSEKYGIKGTVMNFPMSIILSFTFEGRDVVIALPQKETFASDCIQAIETYVSSLAPTNGSQQLRLHFWYLDEREVDGKPCIFGNGVVSGHKHIPDAVKMCTSAVQSVSVDEKAGELVMTTQNSAFHCPLAYCRFRKQDLYPNLIPDYARLKAIYQGKIDYPSIEAGKVLLVLANFCEYYFHSLYYVPEGADYVEPLDYIGYPHTGISQDSYLISTQDYEIDLRYFPHFQNISFYMEDTATHPLFVENIGDVPLYVETHAGTIRLDPGDRKEVSEKNAEIAPPVLPSGDLYPAAK